MSASTTTESLEIAGLLPGHDARRTTAEGWTQWCQTRRQTISVPDMTLGEYQLLSPRRKSIYDMQRLVAHNNMAIQLTPMGITVARTLRRRIQSGATKRLPTTRAGVMINGGGYQGKTETACEVAAQFDQLWRNLHQQANPDAIAGTRDLFAPVAYVRTPVTATPISTCKRILDFYGEDYRNKTLPGLTDLVETALASHGTKVLLLDDITRLKLHREADQDVLDLIRDLMSMNVVLVLIGVGIPESGLLRDGYQDQSGQWLFPPERDRSKSPNQQAATQTQRRFTLVNLDPFRYSTPGAITAWITHLAGIERQLKLFASKPGMLTAGHIPEYLYRRTNGVVGLLEILIEDACAEAIESGRERITIELLDGLDLQLDDLSGRDPAAGEVPSLPPRPNTKRRKARNRVFDDRSPHTH